MILRIASSVGCLAVVACAAVGETETTAADARASLVPTEVAIGHIVHEQCARAEACGNVPSRGVYRDADYCETDLGRATRSELATAPDCAWVDGLGLAACLDAVRAESCALVNAMEREPPACSRARLCR